MGDFSFLVFYNFTQIKETPKQQIISFYKLYSKSKAIHFKSDCYEADGVDISKIEIKCIQEYIKSIETTGLFSCIYIKA